MSSSNQNTLPKTWKKTSTQPTTPLSQRPSDTTPNEKNVTLQISQTTSTTTLTALYEMMTKMQESIDRNYEALTGNMGEMKQDMRKIQEHVGLLDERMGKMDHKMEDVYGILIHNDQKIKNIEETNIKMETRLQFAEARTEYINKNLEEAIINLELEKSAFFLRFQNVIETDQQDLPKTMTEILTSMTNKTSEEITHQIDEIYRVSTGFARRHRLPREVHIRFTKRTTRDEIYNRSKQTTITYQGKEIIVLRQVPRRIREKRRPYQALATKLHKNKITFRWLTPEGLMISLMDKKYKITTPEDAKDFNEQILKLDEDFQQKETLTGENNTIEELSSEDNILEKELDKQTKDHSKNYGPITRAKTEAQREKTREFTR